MHKKIYLILFGPPGSGKGTQVDVLAKKLKLPIISTGELLRHEIEKNTKLGREVKPILASGKLVPDTIVREIIILRLRKNDAKSGVIFDGYPRKKTQLDFLINKLKIDNKNNIYAILIDVSDREVKRRLGGRRACDCGAVYHIQYNPPKKQGYCDLCGKKLYTRDDDRPKVIADRLKLYHKETEFLLKYWSGKNRLIRVNGEQDIKNVQKEIWDKITEIL